VGALGESRDGALDTAGLAVGRQSQGVVRPFLPELEQGGREQWQRARLSLHVADERVGELGLDAQPDPSRRQLDGSPQLRGLHRSDQYLVRAQLLGERRVHSKAAVEVCAQRGHHDCASIRISRSAGERVGEGSALHIRLACREELLELVDREEEACTSGQRVEGLGDRILRSRHERAAELLQRPFPGPQQQTPPTLAAWQHPSSQGRQETGTQDRRLATARGADDREETGADEAGHELGDEPLASEEVLGIDRLEGRETLERADPLGRNARRGGRARESPRLLACELKVGHLTGELGLHLTPVAPARSGAGGDVDEPTARLVDCDRERRPGELPTARVALGGLLRQRHSDDGVERCRQLRPLGARSRRRRLEVREHDRKIRVTPKRRLSDEALVQHAAKRIDVRPPVDLLAGDLLGRDVVDGPYQVGVVADSGLLGDSSRKPEVREVDVVGAVRAGAWVEQHVGGLHVTMDEAARVGGIERARHLREDPDRVPRIEAATLQALFQIRPLDIAHSDEEEVFGRPGLVDRNDVGMVDRRSEFRLTEESITERVVLGKTGGEELERNPPLEPQILGKVDDAHAAPAEKRLDPIAGELGADPGVVAHVHVRILAFALPER
jgi:hypothetical protein